MWTGYIRTYMGADGCAWGFVGALGYKGTSAQQNETKKRQNEQIEHIFCPYGRGNFPGHHVFWDLAKRLTSACWWMLMTSDGCSEMQKYGETGKQGKKGAECLCRACFAIHNNGQKKQKVYLIHTIFFPPPSPGHHHRSQFCGERCWVFTLTCLYDFNSHVN